MKITVEVDSLEELATLLKRLTVKREMKGNDDIRSLNLNVRAMNCLLAENITTITDLQQKSDTDLLKLPNISRLTLNQIREALATHFSSME